MRSGGESLSALLFVVYLWMNRSGAVRTRRENSQMKTKRGKEILFVVFSCGLSTFTLKVGVLQMSAEEQYLQGNASLPLSSLPLSLSPPSLSPSLLPPSLPPSLPLFCVS